ncbi:hypothetical protein [Halosimplex salinum]|uniref:hypothetical protein n=1 Tax=Halosimplex salinum TaxID=1710538 RepID=UPI000F4A5B4F|nr:hypothetical protein [Halosimplex salinum]
MTAEATSSVVRRDLLVAALVFVAGSLSGAGSGFPVDQWWVGVVAAAVTAVLMGASDRSRAGTWAIAAVGGVAMLALLWSGVGVVWSGAGEGIPVDALPFLMVGMSVGMALNRVAFGVVRPVSTVRLARERDGASETN